MKFNEPTVGFVLYSVEPVKKFPPSWNRYFFELVKVIRAKSKDPHTKVGCVIATEDRTLLSTGYNSFPRGLDDNVPERAERPEKYYWIEHAERNAVYNAARTGTKLHGATIYMQGLPCVECARAIVQSGIKVIVYDMEAWKNWTSKKYGAEDLRRSITMLLECGVEIYGVDKDEKLYLVEPNGSV